MVLALIQRQEALMMSETQQDSLPASASVTTAAPSFSAGWGLSLGLLVAALALVILAFHQTAGSIVSIWERSETFAHGYLIIPISLWLVWEKRRGLKRLIPKPTLLPLLLFAPIGFGWLVADLVDTLVVQQFAFVAMLGVTIWAVLGHRIARYSVGSIWRDPAALDPVPDALEQRPAQRAEALRVLGVLFVAAAFWPALSWALSDQGGKVEPVVVSAPETPAWTLLADASGSHSSAWDWRPRIIGADGSVYAFYESDAAAVAGTPVGLYLGVYRVQRQGAELVSSGNMMIEQGHPIWSDTMITPRTLQIGDRKLHLMQHQLSSRRGERLLVWTWYLVGDQHTANPYIAKVLEAKSRLLGRQGEAALIAVAAPYAENKEAAARVLTQFIADLLPAIETEVERSLRQPLRPVPGLNSGLHSELDGGQGN
jgi:EpsI family protein